MLSMATKAAPITNSDNGGAPNDKRFGFHFRGPYAGAPLETLDIAAAFPDSVIVQPGQTVHEAVLTKVEASTRDRFPNARQMSISRDEEGFATIDVVTDLRNEPLWLEGDGADETYQDLAYKLSDMLEVGDGERLIIDLPSRIGTTADRNLVDVGEADVNGDRLITLHHGGMVELDGKKEEFFHCELYDRLTIEHAGTSLTVNLGIDLDLTELAPADLLVQNGSAVADVLAQRFGNAWLSDGWEADPEHATLNIPAHLGRPPFNGGVQTVNTNDCVDALLASGVHEKLERELAYDGLDDLSSAVLGHIRSQQLEGAHRG